MFVIGDKGDNESISDLCSYCNHFEALSVLYKILFLLCLQNIQLATISSDMPLWHVCFVLLLICFFLCLLICFPGCDF